MEFIVRDEEEDRVYIDADFDMVEEVVDAHGDNHGIIDRWQDTCCVECDTC